MMVAVALYSTISAVMAAGAPREDPAEVHAHIPTCIARILITV